MERHALAKKIGEILVERGLLTPGDVNKGLDAQKFQGGRLGSIFLELGMLEERDLLDALCGQKNVQPAKASNLKNVSKGTLALIPAKVASRYQVIPLARENRRLTVALTDPNDLLALDELAFITGCVIEPFLATERTMLNALEVYYGIPRPRRDAVAVPGGPPKPRKASAEEEAPTDRPAPPAEHTQDLLLDDEETKKEAEEARRFWSTDRAADGGAPPAPPVAAAASPATTIGDDVVDGNSLLLDEGASTVLVAEGVPRTLEEAARRLGKAEMRDDIADVILWCTEELFQRSALFIFQKSRTIGWTGQGQGLSPAAVRRVVIPVEDVSIFTLVRDARSHYQGVLPDNPGNRQFVDLLGGRWPGAVLAVPFGIKGRPIGCFYAEDDPDELAAIDLHLLFQLLQKSGLALEMLLLRGKILMT